MRIIFNNQGLEDNGVKDGAEAESATATSKNEARVLPPIGQGARAAQMTAASSTARPLLLPLIGQGAEAAQPTDSQASANSATSSTATDDESKI